MSIWGKVKGYFQLLFYLSLISVDLLVMADPNWFFVVCGSDEEDIVASAIKKQNKTMIIDWSSQSYELHLYKWHR